MPLVVVASGALGGVILTVAAVLTVLLCRRSGACADCCCCEASCEVKKEEGDANGNGLHSSKHMHIQQQHEGRHQVRNKRNYLKKLFNLFFLKKFSRTAC